MTNLQAKNSEVNLDTTVFSTDLPIPSNPDDVLTTLVTSISHGNDYRKSKSHLLSPSSLEFIKSFKDKQELTDQFTGALLKQNVHKIVNIQINYVMNSLSLQSEYTTTPSEIKNAISDAVRERKQEFKEIGKAIADAAKKRKQELREHEKALREAEKKNKQELKDQNKKGTVVIDQPQPTSQNIDHSGKKNDNTNSQQSVESKPSTNSNVGNLIPPKVNADLATEVTEKAEEKTKNTKDSRKGAPKGSKESNDGVRAGLRVIMGKSTVVKDHQVSALPKDLDNSRYDPFAALIRARVQENKAISQDSEKNHAPTQSFSPR